MALLNTTAFGTGHSQPQVDRVRQLPSLGMKPNLSKAKSTRGFSRPSVLREIHAASERESKSKELGMFRRLRVAVERLKNAVGSNTTDLDEVIRGSFGEIISDPFAFAAFMQFPEIDDAWANIASFPPEAVHLIEFVQRAVNEKTGLFKADRGRRTDFYIKLMNNLHPVCVELMQLLDREIAKLESPGFWGKIKRNMCPRPR
ncbi:hypothetical protein [Bradyrhizobium sp. LTSPM299]|uniref:hypothetical protein n=1 Tax=Bradyrhizobium sp. LTSPM299 TaxID=1619233 RepID=UPI0012E25D51|nr:hypothetical protein [Bradyrhizobium sp. LTSPM299]